MTTPLVFLDTETTGVHPGRQVWEIAMIRRDDQGQRRATFFVDVNLADADPFGLKIGGFYNRHPLGLFLADIDAELAQAESREDAAAIVAAFTHGAQIVGAVPSFDAETLAALLRDFGLTPGWSYRLICVESMTSGHLRRPLGGLAKCAEALGVEVFDGAAHTALGDAETAMRIYDTVMNP